MAHELIEHWEKTTGPWSPQQVASILTEFAYLERASAHIRAGWVPKVPELDIKIGLGLHLQQDMEHAAQLLKRAQALVQEDALSIPSGFRNLMQTIDVAKSTQELLQALYQTLTTKLVTLHRKFLDETEPLADATSREMVAVVIEDKGEQAEWAGNLLANWGSINQSSPNAEKIEHLWANRRSGESLILDQWLWPPLDRVPKVARPDHMRRGEPGAMRLLPDHPVEDTGLFLHNFINEEFTTLELIARNTYEHQEMPLPFHRDTARHASDEARHAQMFLDAAARYGVNYGDYPIYTFSYDGLYHFHPCPPGSQKELLWRMLIRQTINEGMALDSLAFEAQKRDYLKQPDLARLFEFVLSDEIFHAASGLKWSRYLCQDDEQFLLRERAAAFEYYSESLKNRRAQWVAEHPEGAVAEVEHLEGVVKTHQFPFKMRTNHEARRQAGFTEEEIQQFPDLTGY